MTCGDMVIGVSSCVRVCCYPEHVLTWEGYGNRRVSSCGVHRVFFYLSKLASAVADLRVGLGGPRPTQKF